MPLDKTQKEIFNWFVHRAYYNCRQAQTLLNSFNNVESTIASFEAIEFSVKAMCKLFSIPYEPKHFGPDTAKTISILAQKVGENQLFNKDKILQTLPIIMSYSDELRILSRYGIDFEKVPVVSPLKIFSRAYAQSVLEDAKVLCDILKRMELRVRWGL